MENLERIISSEKKEQVIISSLSKNQNLFLPQNLFPPFPSCKRKKLHIEYQKPMNREGIKAVRSSHQTKGNQTWISYNRVNGDWTDDAWIFLSSSIDSTLVRSLACFTFRKVFVQTPARWSSRVLSTERRFQVLFTPSRFKSLGFLFLKFFSPPNPPLSTDSSFSLFILHAF